MTHCGMIRSTISLAGCSCRPRFFAVSAFLKRTRSETTNLFSFLCAECRRSRNDYSFSCARPRGTPRFERRATIRNHARHPDPGGELRGQCVSVSCDSQAWFPAPLAANSRIRCGPCRRARACSTLPRYAFPQAILSRTSWFSDNLSQRTASH